MRSTLTRPDKRKRVSYAFEHVTTSDELLSVHAGSLARYRSKRALVVTSMTDIGDFEPHALICDQHAHRVNITYASATSAEDPVIVHLWQEELSEYSPSTGVRLTPRCISLVATDAGAKMLTTEPAWEERLNTDSCDDSNCVHSA